MKKYLLTILCFLLIFTNIPMSECYAENDIVYYKIYSDNNELITEREQVEIDDIIIDKNFNQYKIYKIDNTNFTAKAKFIKQLEKPNINKILGKKISFDGTNKSIALYSTHNDESYLIGDNTESFYGAGGIHDIGIALKKALDNKNVKTVYDETLHIPHNSYAYSRSKATATKLMKDEPNAIFDIHRDGASRNFYLTSNNGSYYSKVRIVVGQGNPNKEANLQFALYLVSVAEKLYPWLIADIYYGSGAYNQNLSSKSLLFEMGCSTIEKNYVLRSVPYLANVITTTLFATTIDEAGDLTIGTTSGTTLDEQLDNLKPNYFTGIIILFATIIINLSIILYYWKKNKIRQK